MARPSKALKSDKAFQYAVALASCSIFFISPGIYFRRDEKSASAVKPIRASNPFGCIRTPLPELQEQNRIPPAIAMPLSMMILYWRFQHRMLIGCV
jgi:hypothetical protein